MSDLLRTERDVADVMGSRASRRSLSTTQHEELKAALLADSYLFARFICKQKELIPEIHRPMSYMVCGLTDRLIDVLNDERMRSYVTDQIRTELWKREIDWRTPEGRAKLDAQLDFQNWRWFRGSYKSSVGTHSGLTYMATRDPNITAKITHATDDKAWEFCAQIAETVLSGTYQDFFPERVPKSDVAKEITSKKIALAGRTVSRPQKTIQAGGYLTKDIGGHYDLFMIDDLVMERNATPELLKGVKTWLQNLEGYRIEAQGVRVRRIHIGTKWDEDDDDAILTSGANARDCITIRLPIETFDSEVVNIMEAGKPTVPQFFSAAKIEEKKRRVVNARTEDAETGIVIDGARSWRCNYLLDAYAGGARLFSPVIVDDPFRSWMLQPYHDEKRQREHPGRFLVARYLRTEQGHPVPLDGKRIRDAEGHLLDNWYLNAKIVRYDPWRDLDRVVLVDPAWADKVTADNWAVSVVGSDHERVSLQLETRSDTTGLEGWVVALCEIDELWHPRVIGFDGGAYQDAVIKNMIKTDKRLRRMRSRMVPVPHNNRTKTARMREGIAEPLKMYRFMLDPRSQMTRDELKGIRGIPSDRDGIADSLSMAPAVLKRRRPVQDDDAKLPARQPPKIHAALGVPYGC